MGLFRKLFGEETQSKGMQIKDVQFYANRLSEQMYKIAKLGLKIESYHPKVYKKCANRGFIGGALNAFRSVGGQAGDAELEIYRDIDKDFRTMQSFMDDWRDSADIDKKVVFLAENLNAQLKKLKEFMADTSPDMVAGRTQLVTLYIFVA